jgi:hypothetical protein
MARIVVLLFILIATGAASGQTPTLCPWASVGTAERLLGGEVSLSAHVEANGTGSCSFTRKDGDGASAIEILVSGTDTRPCPQDSVKLKALGNEAVQCRLSTSASQKSDRIAGRIRRVFFVVTLTNIPGATNPEPSDPRLADAYAASPLERLAEQVVGNLY